MKRIGIFFISTLFTLFLMGEENFMENLELDNDLDYQEKYEELLFYSQNKIYINYCSKEQLEALYFLTDFQILNIIKYREKYGKINSIYELYLIEGIDKLTAEKLHDFICYDEIIINKNFNDFFKCSKHEFINKMTLKSSNLNQNYLGSPLYEYFRYNFFKRDKFSFGLVFEKDTNEPFLYQNYLNFISTHFMIENIKKLKRLILGNYKINFGQGLIMKTDNSLGKSSNVMNIQNRENGINRQFSSNETNYLHGIGFCINITKKLKFNSFYSFKNLDGNLKNNKISSIKTDGIFKTKSDFYKKNTFNEHVLGGNLSYTLNNFKIGTNAIFYKYNKELINENLYKKYNYDGKLGYNLSIDYKLVLNYFQFFGETALDKNQHFATINGIIFYPSQTIGIAMLHRFYSKKFVAPYANSFCNNSSIKNEHGLFTSININEFKNIGLSGYFDVYKFPFLKYNIDYPTIGWDGMFQTEFKPNSRYNMYFRYKAKYKEFNNSVDKIKQLSFYTKHSFKYNISYVINNHFFFSNSLEYNYIDYEIKEKNYGFALSQNIGYKKNKINLNVGIIIFDAKKYDNRVYLYEKDVLHTFSNFSFYGEGIKVYINNKFFPLKNFELDTKLTYTHLTNNYKTYNFTNVFEGKLLLKYIVN